MTKLLFITALALSACAAYYSVMGLLAIFAAAVIPIFIMGSLLEAAKLVVASWLYRSWNEIPKLMKVYFTTALIILMLLTSMGIFGYLSKAHLDQAVPTGDIAAKLSLIEEKIKTEKENLNAARKELNQLDQQVDQTISRTTDSAGADRAIAIRRGQQKDRARILNEIGQTQAKIAKLNEERAPIASEVRKVEAEVGPIKYIAALIYGDNPEEDVLEKAVRWVIIMIVIVFDPLAVLMLVAANWNMKRDQELIQPETPEPITIPPTPLPEESKSIIKDFFKPKEAKVETHHHATTKHIIELEDGIMVGDMAHVEHLPEKPPRQPLR
jgi:outer membrane murein-binding lipoprotein Lpp